MFSDIFNVFPVLGLLNEYLSQTEDDDHLDPDTEDPQPVVVDDDDPHTEDTTMLQNCFTSIVDTLASTNPRSLHSMVLLEQYFLNKLAT